MADLDGVRRAFADANGFTSSPLYQSLSRTVATDESLLRLASRAGHGQYPTFLFFGAVHHLLLGGADHELAEFYPSIAGDRARPAGEAGPALVSFCVTHRDELTHLLRTRLVQTSVVQRSLGLRLGLYAVAREENRPVHLVEVGASAGLNLRFDRYGFQVGGRLSGDPDSPVRIAAQWYGERKAPDRDVPDRDVPDRDVPDLDALPPVASVTGVDLRPIDPRDADARRWLESLIWPENHHQRGLLAAALAVVAADPPRVLGGDATEVCPRIAAGLPAGEPRVVFHAATRLHVAPSLRADFDRAVDALGDGGPLYRLSLEYPPDPDPRRPPARPGVALTLRRPDGTRTLLAVVEGHLHWIEPVQL